MFLLLFNLDRCLPRFVFRRVRSSCSQLRIGLRLLLRHAGRRAGLLNGLESHLGICAEYKFLLRQSIERRLCSHLYVITYLTHQVRAVWLEATVDTLINCWATPCETISENISAWASSSWRPIRISSLSVSSSLWQVPDRTLPIPVILRRIILLTVLLWFCSSNLAL